MLLSGQAVLCANLQRRLRVRLSSCGILLNTMLSAFLERLQQVHRSRNNATAEPVKQRPILHVPGRGLAGTGCFFELGTGRRLSQQRG